MFVESPNEITSVAEGKVVLIFMTGCDDDPGNFTTKVLEFRAKALIIASKREDAIQVVDIDPIQIKIDYEQGTVMMKYIGSTRYTDIYIYIPL